MFVKALIETTLASDMPAGPNGQPAHKKGAGVASMQKTVSKSLGEIYFIPPNPVHLYLNHAEKLIKSRKYYFNKCKNSIIENTFPLANGKTEKMRSIRDYKYICNFFERSLLIPITLFSAIESFCNQCIPEDYKYKNKKGIELNKLEIERYIGTDKKLKKILKEIFNKDITKEKIWSDFWQIKDLRDEIMHLKTANEKEYNWYNKIFLQLIDYNPKNLLQATCQLITFYKPKLFKK